MTRRRIRRSGRFLLLLGAAACADRLPTLDVTPPDGAVLDAAPADGTVLLRYRFGAADGADGSNGIGWTPIGEPFTEAMWIEVRTDGHTTYEVPPEAWDQLCGSFCSYPDPPFGDKGAVGGNGMLGPHYGGVDIAMYWPSSPGGVVPNDNDYNVENGQRVRLIYTQPGQQIWLRRRPIPGEKNCWGCAGGVPEGPVGWYIVKGGHDITMRTVMPVAIGPDRQYFERGDTLTWSSSVYPGMTQFTWQFQRLGTGNWGSVVACQGQPICRYAPPDSGGTMRLLSKWRSEGLTGHFAIALSPPVHEGEEPCPGAGRGGASFVCEEEQEPELVCTNTPVRGEPVECRVTIPDASLVRWEFSTGAGGDKVTESATEGGSLPLTWKGIAVQGGTVTASVERGGQDETYTAQFAVANRSWGWSSNSWHLSEGTAQALTSADDPRVIEPAFNASVVFGWNCHDPTCRGRWVQPDIRQNDEAGYTLDSVPSGPNRGYWYVASAQYEMRRATNLNPHVLESAPTRLITGGQATECRNNGMSGTGSVAVNFYTFNKVCKGVDIDTLVAAAWAHEARGTTGHNGHQSVAEDFAGQSQNDPHLAVELLWDRSREALKRQVVRNLRRTQDRIDNRGGDHSYVKGNYSGQVWMWNPSTRQYEQTTVRF